VSTPGFVRGFVPDSGGAEASPAKSASDRIEASRARLREAIREKAAAELAAAAGQAIDPDATPFEKLLQRWRAWRPLGVAGTLASRTAGAVVGPIVQRHPVRMTLGAALMGGLLVWSRPWKWALGSALLAGWLPGLFAQRRTSARGIPWFPLASAIAAAALRPRDAAAPARPSTGAVANADTAAPINSRIDPRIGPGMSSR
jgi:hypothetical protein